MTGAQFDIRIDGTPRSYRDRKDYDGGRAVRLVWHEPSAVESFVELAEQLRLPAISIYSQFAADGGLMAYGPDMLSALGPVC
jgi:hypothetical protein